MSYALSRRKFLSAGAALGALSLLPAEVRADTGVAPRRLIAGTRTLDVNGRGAKVFRLADASGAPGLVLAPGERFRVDLINQAATSTIIHWHGQLPPWTQDGFPWPETPPIAAGATQAYDYAPIPGTFWMHSHDGLQEQSLMTAPLIVRSVADMREDRHEIVLMLHDFSFRSPDEILASLVGTSPGALAHEKAKRMEQAAAPTTRKMDSTDMSATSMADKSMGGMSMSHGAADLNDVSYDAFLANDRTLSDPEIVRVDKSARVKLRIINGASSSQFWIDLGSLTGHVIAVDGHNVRSVAGKRFPIAMAQRLDILLDLPASGIFPILARLEGSAKQTGIVLATPGANIARIADEGDSMAPPVDNSLEARLSALESLTRRKPDLVHRIVLSGAMKPYAWALDGAYWPDVAPLMLTKGQRVEVDLINHSKMAHPMHLHGHSFQVLAIDGRPVHGAVRDTVVVTPMGSVRIAFDADNPGRWAFHCHNLYHMATGMMTEFRYRDISI